MVFLKKLEMTNFKSYGDKKVTLTFPRGFTAIFGPNGSGKSNIMDAVLFVLGNLSSKNLRASILTDLIFAGGEQGKQPSYAKVTLWLDNSDKLIPVDSNEVQISRRINKDGRSEYRLNGKLATRTEIVDVLSLVNASPGGLNIIMQGEVARIVLMSPLERRKLIEDIAGISQFEEKREKAQKELEEAKRKFSQLELLYSEAQKRIERLRREKEEAEKWIELSQRIKDLKAALLKVKVTKIDEKVKEVRDRLMMIEERRAKISREREEVINAKHSVEAKIAGLEEDKRRVAEDVKKLASEEQEVSARIAELRAELKYWEERLKEARMRKERLNALLESIEKEEHMREEEVMRIEAERKRLLEELAREEEALRAITDNKKMVEEKSERVRRRINELREAEREAERRISYAREKLNEALSTLALIEAGLNGKRRELALLEEEKGRVESEALRIENEIKLYEEMFGRVSLILPILLQERQKLEFKVDELRDMMERLRNEEAKAKAMIEAEQVIPPERRREIVDCLRSRGVNVYGFLVDLCESVDVPGPLRSIFMAILVEKVSDVQAALNCIREMGLVRATVFPREAVKACVVEDRSFARMIKSDEFKDVFDYLLGDIILGEGFERGVDVITEYGTLYSRKGLVVYEGLELREDTDLSALSSEAQKVQRRTMKFRRLVERTAAAIAVLERERESLIRRREKGISKFASLKEELEELKRGIDEVRRVIDDFQVKRDLQRKEVERLSVELKEVEEEARRITTARREVEKEDVLLQAAELEKKLMEKEKRIAGLREELRKVEVTLARLQGGREKLGKERIVSELSDVEKEIEEALRRQGSIKASLSDAEKLLADRRRAKEELEEEMRELQREIDAEGVKLKGIDEKVRSLTKVFEEVLSAQGEVASELSRMEAERRGIEKEIEELQLDIGKVPLPNVDAAELEKEMTRLFEERKKLEPVNLKAPEQFEKALEEISGFEEKIRELIEERRKIEEVIEEISRRKREAFMEAFNSINRYFGEFFSELSPGGWAKLVLENEEDPFEGGVVIKAKPAGKEIKSIEAMSGGEKSLTTIAFIFAFYRYKPAPFYLLDEIDAFLDKENVKRVAKLIKKLSKESQFIVITLKDIMVSEADMVYGVTSVDGVSSIVGVNLQEVLPYTEEKERGG
ncbi:MAG: chromosome segregation protein SMC [Candidatus Jordarchaeales archaeon]